MRLQVIGLWVAVIVIFGGQLCAAEKSELPKIIRNKDGEPVLVKAPTGYVKYNDQQKMSPIILPVPDLNMILYVESDGRYVTAISSDGKILWHLDPHKEVGLPSYRVSKPMIRGLEIHDHSHEGSEWMNRFINIDEGPYISIGYTSSQFGLLRAKTGEFIF